MTGGDAIAIPGPCDRAPAPCAVSADVAAVVIGRNEGERLRACLASLTGLARQVVYVDSGSSDTSVETALAAGAWVVRLDPSIPFTAARARNAGLSALGASPPVFVQLLDGDCTLDAGWIATALAVLDADPRAAVACGRRRERHPEASVYNRLCDREWDTPIGRTASCGGDALMRWRALVEVGSYRDELIAGEEPELCVRLRRAGWHIWRLDAEMTRHDAALARFSQWWRRTRRAGFAFAAGAALHGAPPERHYVTETRRALAWGAALPLVATLLAAVAGPVGLGVLVAYPAQIVRLAARERRRRRAFWNRGTWEWAFFTTVGKAPEAIGVIGFHADRLLGRRADLVEYK